jgi:hypothetical protein
VQSAAGKMAGTTVRQPMPVPAGIEALETGHPLPATEGEQHSVGAAPHYDQDQQKGS